MQKVLWFDTGLYLCCHVVNKFATHRSCHICLAFLSCPPYVLPVQELLERLCWPNWCLVKFCCAAASQFWWTTSPACEQHADRWCRWFPVSAADDWCYRRGGGRKLGGDVLAQNQSCYSSVRAGDAMYGGCRGNHQLRILLLQATTIPVSYCVATAMAVRCCFTVLQCNDSCYQ